MLVLLLLTALNALLKNAWINSEFLRFNISALPVNILDMVILVGIVVSLFPKGQFFFETERPHPIVGWAIGLLVVAVFGAGLGALHNGASARQAITTARNLFEVPMLVYLGYRLLPRPSSIITYCYFLIFVGFVVGAVISLSFGGQVEDLTGGTDITSVRVVDYVSNYAGLAAALLLFSIGSGAKPLFPTWMCVLLAAACFVGQFSTLSRSDWLAASAGIAAAVAMMPKYRFSSKFVYSVIVFPIMGLVLYVSMVAATMISGKDVVAKMGDRFISMLPGEREGTQLKAWDTRLSGAIAEIGIWARSPLIGGGFGVQDAQQEEASYRHNTWTSTLAESGLLGFSGMAVVCIGQIVIGRRMIKDRLDRSSVLAGGLGVITGVHFIVHGYCTMSFNQVRWAIPMAMTFGMVARCRAMQLTMARQYAGYLPDDYQHDEGIAPLLNDDESIPSLSTI